MTHSLDEREQSKRNKIKKIDKRNVQDILSLSSMQLGILYHYLKNPEGDEYFEQVILEITGEIQPDRFQQSWDYVVKNNEILRSMYYWEKQKEPFMVILKDHSVALTIHDLRHLEQSNQHFEEILAQDRQRKLDLQQVPFRVTLCQFANNKQVIILSYHHILFDGWSLGIVLKEFFTCYEAISFGHTVSLRIKPPFKEFIHFLKNRVTEEEKNYWQTYLAGSDDPARSQVSIRRNQAVGNSGEVKIVFPTELTQRSHEFIKKEQVTLAALFYGVWGVLLQRYTFSEEVIFGMVQSGRTSEIQGIEDMVGLFINTLPCRIMSHPSEQVVNFLQRLNSTIQLHEKFQFISLAELQHHAGNNQLGSLMVIENYPISQFWNKNSLLKVNSYSIFEQTHYDLTVVISTLAEIEIKILYKSAVYSHETVSKLASHFCIIVQEMLHDRYKKVNEINLLTEKEKRQILEDFNETYMELPQDVTVNDLWDVAIKQYRDRIGIKYQGQLLTYHHINERIHQLARFLAKKGVGRNSIVAVMLERSPEMLIGILGIIRAGGAYLPIDPMYPDERKDYILRDSCAQFLLTDVALLLSDVETEVIRISDERIWSEEITDLNQKNMPTDLTYAIYTSGSTGKPKGVAIQHRNVVNILSVLQEIYPVAKDEGYLFKTNYTFDVSVTEMFGWFLGGGHVVILPSGLEKDPLHILQVIAADSVTHINFTPSMLEIFVDLARNKERGMLHNLKYIFSAGESLSLSLAEKLLLLGQNFQLVNLYGPTEATVYSTGCTIRDISTVELIPIGRPLGNIRVYIMTPSNTLQPVNIAGELCIGGSGVGNGYLNRKELAEKKFIEDPFHPEERMYRTGDLAKWLPDGNIVYLGRLDQQVKIRGMRIELGEIEYCLLKHPMINEAVVLVWENQQGEKELCAYFTAHEKIESWELRAHLAQKLPNYMIPTYFIPVHQFPLTPNGKINRSALPEPCVKPAEMSHLYTAPETRIEERLTQLVEETLLTGKKIGVTDPLFELGLHSLKAMMLMAQIQKEFNISMTLTEIFNYSTIQELGGLIEQGQRKEYVQIPLMREREDYPLSSAQKRLFFLDQMDKHSLKYHITSAMLIQGEILYEKWETAFAKLIQRHAALRTYFTLKGEEPVQKILGHVDFKLEYSCATSAEINDMVKSWVNPFDLSKAPLFRAQLIQVEDRHLFLLDLHHIISDGISMNILMQDFIDLYFDRSLMDLPVKYTDMVIWQNQHLTSEWMVEQERYWLGRLQNEVSVLNFPTDFPRPAMMDYIGAVHRFALDRDTTASLQELATRQEVTLFMVLLAAYYILLAKYSGQEDIIIGSPIAGRHHAEMKHVVGMFVNTLALRNQPTGEKSYIQFLNEVKANTLRDLEHQDYPFEILVEQLKWERDLSRNPLFDVLFVLQNEGAASIVTENVTFAPLEMDSGISNFDLVLNGSKMDGQLTFRMEYWKKLFKEETIQTISGHYINILNAILKNPEVKIAEIQMLSYEDKNRIISQYDIIDVNTSHDEGEFNF